MDALVQQTSKLILAQGSQGAPGMSMARELHIQDWKQARILEGRGFIATVGALSTPVVGGGAGTIVDNDQPEFGMIVPANYVVVPLRIAAQLSTPLGATDADETEFIAFVDTTAATVAAALDGTWANTITPKNMRIALNNAIASACTVKSVCSADTTEPTESIDLFHTLYTYETKTDAGYNVNAKCIVMALFNATLDSTERDSFHSDPWGLMTTAATVSGATRINRVTRRRLYRG